MPVRLLFAALLCSLLWGQEGGVPVIIDGKEVVRIYSSLGHFTAEERAVEIEHRIVSLAEKGYAGGVTTRAIATENATAVIAGGGMIMAVTEPDAQAAGVPQGELARRYAASIQTTIEVYRTSHTWLSFLWALFKTVVAWTLFCGLVWLLVRAVGWLSGWLQRWSNRRVAARGVHGVQVTMLERGRHIVVTAVQVIAGLFLLSVLSFLLSYTFGLYPATAGISTTLWDYLRSTFGAAGQAIADYIPNGGVVLIVVALTHYLLKVLKFLARAVEEGELPVKGIHPEMAKPTFQIVRILVLLFALVVVFPYLPGGKSEAFKGVSIFLGLLLSLGSSSAVSNVLAGLVLTYMRPFRVGDRVKIVDTVGDVLERSLLVTRVRTIKNVEVVIPNGAILSNQILNYSALARSQGLILNTTVTIGYDAPWRTVHELLIRAALNTEGVLSDPAPFVLETSLNDFHISYEINAFTDRPNEMVNIYSRLHEAIQDSFNKGGVEIMSPTFYALRDGNTVTTPEKDRPAGYEAPAFRLKNIRPFQRDQTRDGRAARQVYGADDVLAAETPGQAAGGEAQGRMPPPGTTNPGG